MNRSLSPERLQSQKSLVLDEAESHHLIHVLRKSVGNSILLLDGRGGLGEARIIEIKKRNVEVELVSIKQAIAPHPLVLAFGISKPAALEFLVRRCTEVGVTRYQPLVTQHSQSEKMWNSERWTRIVAEVCKQCERSYFPTLSTPITLSEFLDHREKGTFFYCSETKRKSEAHRVSKNEGVQILVGSEGGWSKEELIVLEMSGGVALGLGPNRLRTETAALSAVVRVQMLMEVAVL